MNRRELLKMISAATGTAMVGGGALLTGCSQDSNYSVENVSPRKLVFSAQDVQLLDEVAETILPCTDTPGAKDAEVGQFMTVFVRDCYTQEEQEQFHIGLVELQEASVAAYGHNYLHLETEQRQELLRQLDATAKAQVEQTGNAHYFTMIKQLTLFGFFTSEPGATQALRYEAVPGRYDSCIEYEKGDRAWAT
jgi:hypothetical protein